MGLALVLAPVSVGAQRLVDPEGVREREESRPLRLCYTGGPVPFGARLETRYHTGWAVGGFTMAGVGWFWTVASSFLLSACPCDDSPSGRGSPMGWALVPIVGPIIFAAASDPVTDGIWGVMIMLSVAQVAGLTWGLVGALTSVRYVVMPRGTTADASPQMRWTLAPGTTATPSGLTFSASF